MTYKPQFKPYDEVLAGAKRRVPILSDSYYEQIPRQMRTYAFTVSSIERVSQVQDILESLNRAVEEGQTFAEWQSTVNIKDFQSLAQNRQELVFRMHSQTAYNQGHLQIGLENPDLVPWLKYQAIGDERTRPNHMANDGITRPVDDEFWLTNTPPLGYNCRCFLLNITAREAQGDKENLTPPKQLEKPELLPDKGFRYNKRDPVSKLDRYLAKKIETLPPDLKESMTQYVGKKDLDNDIWWEQNKEFFE